MAYWGLLDCLPDDIHNGTNRLCRQFRINGQRQTAAGGRLRNRKVADSVVQIFETFLKMERDRIIDIKANAIFLQTRDQYFALISANDELVIDVFGRRRLERKFDIP